MASTQRLKQMDSSLRQTQASSTWAQLQLMRIPSLRYSPGQHRQQQHETSMEWPEYFSQFQDTTDALSCHIHLSVCLWIMDPHSRATKKNISHENKVPALDTAHLVQRPCCQRGSPCQDPGGNWITPRPPDHRKDTQTAVV